MDHDYILSGRHIFVRLVESGLFDAKSMVGQVFRSDKMKEALQVAADRSAMTSVIDFT